MNLDINELQRTAEAAPDFGDYVMVEQKRFGVPNEFYRYKVVGRLQSSAYTIVPVTAHRKFGVAEDGVVDVLDCVCCGVREDLIERFRIEDVTLCKPSRGAVMSELIQRLKAAEAWLPIETAPKDGSMFLCWVSAVRYGETDEGQTYQQDVSQVDFCCWRTQRDIPDCGWFDPCCGQIGDAQHVAHWRPLPPPPETNPTAAGEQDAIR